MGGVWVMDLREGGSGTDRCLGEKRKEQKKEKPTLKRGCPEKEGLRQVSGWNIHTCSSFVLWLVHILDISSGYFNLPSN